MTTKSGASESLARAIFALLVVGSFGAFFVTQRLKHTPTAVQGFELTPVFSPTPRGHIKQEQIAFKIAHADKVTVTIVGLNGEQVATLVSEQPLGAYTVLSLRWNGRRGTAASGAPAPEGEYRVGVSLKAQKVFRLSPKSFMLIRRVPPKGSSSAPSGSRSEQQAGE